MDQRLEAARNWLAEHLDDQTFRLAPISGDASFRRYFRVSMSNSSVILMDAPPDQEDSRPFTDIAARLKNAEISSPEVYYFDHELGFGLLEDLGDQLYHDLIEPAEPDQYIPPLFDTLQRMAERVDATGLPEYDDRLLRQELELYPDWYLAAHKGTPLTQKERMEWEALCGLLISSANEQPQRFVHRDFHSCNLMRRAPGEPAVIDFQDAVLGPVSYDFVSLIWDRYVSWPRPQLEQWMSDYHDRMQVAENLAQWVRWCDWMGLQRNLKIVGIFARLHYRDGKDGYLEMIPRFHRYVLDVLPRYPEFRRFIPLLEVG